MWPITNHAYCCYVSILAVVQSAQRSGIGRRLLEETRTFLGPEVSMILISASDSVEFYKKKGMPGSRELLVLPP